MASLAIEKSEMTASAATVPLRGEWNGANRAPALEPVVFLPGLLCDQALWRGQVHALADVAAPMIADLTLDDTIGAMAERTLAAAPRRFSLAGLSMGGYVALEIMRRAPERVSRLALINSSARSDTPERQRQRQAGIESLRRGKFVGITHRLLGDLVHSDHTVGPVADEMRGMASRVGGDAFIRQQHAIMTRPASLDSLEAIGVPTMVVVGDGDRITPPDHAREIHERIAASSFHMIGSCGHMAALEHPEQVNFLLRNWLLDEAA
ncbi:alpha/beta fold hydrolase [Novosphingobium sp.]|uniref:alpha/beta fold hydrolase n=1 Tax=Novosphingobium sp. TaxID=1874826 RepID=UPI0028A70AD1|nr:alpha/beta fold hydrolase [Novosphingobium sp.]